MKSNRIYEDLLLIRRRAKWVFILVEILFVFLIFYFWKLQVLDHKEYWEKSEANRMREITLSHQRGLIKDRNGTILANNKASFKVSLIRENCEDYEKSCRKISRLLKIEEDILKKRVKKYESLPLFKPIVIKENLSLEEVAAIEARKIEFPELILQSEPKRSYPYGNLAAHVIGYLQELSPEEIKTGIYSNRRLGDLVGKTGIEKQYEDRLLGSDGQLIEIVDSLGRSKGEVTRNEPTKGPDLYLTLDINLQKKAEELLEGRDGSIIVMDAQTGGILALASYPNFDPNKFISRFTPDEWLDLVNSPQFPLMNRAVRGMYSPGSVFKLTVALGALDLGIVTDETTFMCKGSIEFYGEPWACWIENGHGRVNLYDGIRNSCNIYIYNLGKEMGIEQLSHYAKMLGFGTKTGIDLPGEKSGLVPDPQWKRKTKKESWHPGETISVSIGQSFLLVTPIQIAAHTALIANRGKKVTPHFLMSPSDLKKKNEAQLGFSGEDSLMIDPSIFEKIIQGMWEVVNNKGTGWAARVYGYDVCGKTGSTQTLSSDKEEGKQKEEEEEEEEEVKTHSWFTGFAPRDNPQVVVTVLVEYGGMGGTTAAPLARKMLDLYRKTYDR
jgi:penicillin-binding protein 2